MSNRFDKYLAVVNGTEPIKYLGRVVRVVGLTIESIGPKTEIGELVSIRTEDNNKVLAEVVGFNKENVILMPFGGMTGIYPGCEVVAMGTSLSIPMSEGLKGRILNGIGKAIDGKEEVYSPVRYSIYNTSPNPIKRTRINKSLETGVKAIDTLTTVGQGQRIGIFSGAGVGKSTLLGMVTRNMKSDVNVIALIGERGREVKEFIEKDLGAEGLQRSVLIVATADATPIMRIKGAFVATAIAEYFRDQGQNVTLMMDSITRFARAQREIGLAVGEPPATRGYTPSVFTVIPELLERAGTNNKGSITGFYNVLVEADDMNEPVSDIVRGHLDGHISLNRQLANRGHYPAIDVTDSISRIMVDVVSPKVMDYASKVKKIISVYKEAEDLINIGAYVKGSNPEIDYSVSMIDKVYSFLRQGIYERYKLSESGKMLFQLFDDPDFILQENFKGFEEEYSIDQYRRIKKDVFEEQILTQISNEESKELLLNHYMYDRMSEDYILKENRTHENEIKIVKLLKSIK